MYVWVCACVCVCMLARAWAWVTGYIRGRSAFVLIADNFICWFYHVRKLDQGSVWCNIMTTSGCPNKEFNATSIKSSRRQSPEFHWLWLQSHCQPAPSRERKLSLTRLLIKSPFFHYHYLFFISCRLAEYRSCLYKSPVLVRFYWCSSRSYLRLAVVKSVGD